MPDKDRLFKKVQVQGAQILRNEAYITARRKPAPANAGEGCSATPQMSLFQQPARRS